VGIKSENAPTLNELLRKMGRKLTEVIKKKRPDVYQVVCENGLLESDFGIFHLFMSPRGGCGIHNDPNDFLSVVVGVSSPSKAGLIFFFYFINYFNLQFQEEPWKLGALVMPLT
jgi:hypothetical protein